MNDDIYDKPDNCTRRGSYDIASCDNMTSTNVISASDSSFLKRCTFRHNENTTSTQLNDCALGKCDCPFQTKDSMELNNEENIQKQINVSLVFSCLCIV